ncbi:MAG: DUF4123 domain-containing protein [Planctomycetota bacterium]
MSATEDVFAPRPVALRLRSGETIEGLLVHRTPALLALEVDDRLLEVAEPEVVALRYLDGDEAWERELREAEREAERGPVTLERLELVPPDERAGSQGEQRRVAALNELALGAPDGLLTHALVRATALPGILSALESFKVQVFPLFERYPTESRHQLPYLMTLDPEASWPRSLLKRLGPNWGVLIRSRSELREVARLLTWLLKARIDGGQERTFRYHDPRVLRDYLEVARAEDVGTLFGGAWCRDPSGRAELLCPCCDAELPALARECSGCAARFSGEETGPFLIESFLFEDLADRHTLWRATPWPPAPRPGRAVPARLRQRGRKQLRLTAEQIAHMGAAYLARGGDD